MKEEKAYIIEFMVEGGPESVEAVLQLLVVNGVARHEMTVEQLPSTEELLGPGVSW